MTVLFLYFWSVTCCKPDSYISILRKFLTKINVLPKKPTCLDIRGIKVKIRFFELQTIIYLIHQSETSENSTSLTFCKTLWIEKMLWWVEMTNKKKMPYKPTTSIGSTICPINQPQTKVLQNAWYPSFILYEFMTSNFESPNFPNEYYELIWFNNNYRVSKSVNFL